MAVTVSVPGRIEWLGNHTDYNGGRVLVLPTGRAVCVTIEAVSAPRITIRSAAYGKIIRGSLPSFRRAAGELAWANYVLGALKLGLAAWPQRGGLSVEIGGDLPAEFGLSSSAALSVAVLRALARMAGRRVAIPQIAELAQRVENDFVGVPVGPLDPMSCAAGRRGWITHLDFADKPRIQRVRMPHGWRLLLFETGAARSLRASAYARRRAECAAAARKLGVSRLGQISAAEFSARECELPALLRCRARHVIHESMRVDMAFAILRSEGDPAKIGDLMNASQESSRGDFQNSHPAIEKIVSQLRKLRGVAGARLTGGGFGGAVIAWVEAKHAPPVIASMNQSVAGGARLLDMV